MLDRDLRLYGLLGMCAAIDAGGAELGSYASDASAVKNADAIPVGSPVNDPVFADLLAQDGQDPNRLYYPPIGASPGEYTLNDLVEYYKSSSIDALSEWLPQGKGTERGALEVELVNDFVGGFYPTVLEEGAEVTYSLGPAEMLLHDVLNEGTDYPADGTYEEQIAWCNAMLEAYIRNGRD